MTPESDKFIEVHKLHMAECGCYGYQWGHGEKHNIDAVGKDNSIGRIVCKNGKIVHKGISWTAWEHFREYRRGEG